MTTKIYSIDEALSICEGLFKILETTGFTDYKVAGGFLRDADNGVAPKDIDLYVRRPRVEDPRRRASRVFGPQMVPCDDDALEVEVIRFYNKLGHKKVRTGSGELRNGYPEGFSVWESIGVDLPVNLIVSTDSHPAEFDMGICEISCWPTGTLRRDRSGEIYRSRAYEWDKENKCITINRMVDPLLESGNAVTVGQIEKLVNHVKRVKAKYSGHRVCIGDWIWMLLRSRSVYAGGAMDFIVRLQEEGLIGKAGQVLQAETEVIDWDEVRQRNREDRPRDDALDAVQAVPGTIRNTAQVQARLQGIDLATLWIDETPFGRGQGVLPRGV